MAESTTSSAAIALVDAGITTFTHLIDGDMLFGAVLGAWLVSSTRRNLKVWQRLGSLLLSIGVGYLFAPIALRAVPFINNGGSAFFCALVIIPISIKLMVWIENTDIIEIWRRFKGGQ